MKPETLQHMKQDLKELLSCVEAILVAWPSNQLTMISVMLQNAAFVGIGTHKYSHEEECIRVKALIDAIKAVATYDKEQHTINWIAEEATMIYDGNRMAEIEDEITLEALDH